MAVRLLLIAGLFCAGIAVITAAGWLWATPADPTTALAWLAAAVAFNIGSKLT